MKKIIMGLMVLSFLNFAKGEELDPIVIDSEESLSKAHAAQLDSDEMEKKREEVSLQSQHTIEEAKKNISQAKSDEIEYNKKRKKAEADIKNIQLNVKQLQAQEAKLNLKKNSLEQQLKTTEQNKNDWTSRLDKQKVKNDEDKTKLTSLLQRKKELLRDIYKLKINMARLSKKSGKQKNQLSKLDSQVKKLIEQRTAMKQ